MAEEEKPSGTYRGACHCGAVVFNITISPPFPEYEINLCNCSVCTKSGYMLVYPRREHVEFVKGSIDSLKSYQMGRKIHKHRFCDNCGGSVLIDFEPEEVKKWGFGDGQILAVNVSLAAGFVELAMFRSHTDKYPGSASQGCRLERWYH